MSFVLLVVDETLHCTSGSHRQAIPFSWAASCRLIILVNSRAFYTFHTCVSGSVCATFVSIISNPSYIRSIKSGEGRYTRHLGLAVKDRKSLQSRGRVCNAKINVVAPTPPNGAGQHRLAHNAFGVIKMDS